MEETEPTTSASDAIFEPIVATLMAQDYCIADDFIDAGTCRYLLDFLQKRQTEGQFKKAGIGRGNDFMTHAGIRGDEILWVEKGGEDNGLDRFLDKLEALIAYCNRSSYAGIRDYEAHFAVYPPGAYYHRHLDQFRGNDNRRFTFILYMNFDWQPSHGGLLRMYLPAEDGETILDVAPTAGRLVCFRSAAIPHEVLPTTETRYSITGWWLEREKELSFLC